MFCSGCGQALAQGLSYCPQCGRPVAPAAPPMPPFAGFSFDVENYRGKIKTLAIVWFVYAGFSMLWGFAGLNFARHFFMGGFGPWMNHGGPPAWFFPAIVQIVWVGLLVRAALAVAAGWGLLQHAPWGRIIAIIAAILSLIKIPFGTAMGIWTLVVLLGYRNATLYEQL